MIRYHVLADRATLTLAREFPILGDWGGSPPTDPLGMLAGADLTHHGMLRKGVARMLSSRQVRDVIAEDLYKVGRTKVFLRKDVVHMLDGIKHRLINKSLLLLQAHTRGRIAWLWYSTVRDGMIRLQSLARGSRTRREHRDMLADLHWKQQQSVRLPSSVLITMVPIMFSTLTSLFFKGWPYLQASVSNPGVRTFLLSVTVHFHITGIGGEAGKVCGVLRRPRGARGGDRSRVRGGRSAGAGQRARRN